VAPAAHEAAHGERWKMTVNTPVGVQEMTLQIARDGGVFTGTMETPAGPQPVTDGKIAGDALAWTVSIKKPTAVKLSFEVTIEGDAMAGQVKLGMFGKSAVSGLRLAS
jgi:hypothetical protein